METHTSPVLQSHSGLSHVQTFTAQVYAWMTAGLLVTAAVALLLNSNIRFVYWVYVNSWVIGISALLELLLVIVITNAINRLSTVVAGSLFIVYAVLNGIFFSVLLAIYDTNTVAVAFGATALTFLTMSVYGAIAKADLTKWGHLAIMALIGVIIASIVNLFAQSSQVTWILTYISVGVFLVLVAYDTQKLREYADNAETTGHPSRYAVVAALSLYLDFINLLILIVRIMGRGKN